MKNLNRSIGLTEEEVSKAGNFDLRAFAVGEVKYVVKLVGLDGNYLVSYDPNDEEHLLSTSSDEGQARTFHSPEEANAYCLQESANGDAFLASFTREILGFVEEPFDGDD